MVDIKELTDELTKLQSQIKTVLRLSNYREYDDLSDIQYSRTPDNLLLVDEYRGILDKLSDMEYDLDYLNRPVEFEDILTLRLDGRYGCRNHNQYYTSGTPIEFLYYDEVCNDSGEFETLPMWRCSRVEHNGSDYYVVGYSDVELNNLKVRVRKR